MNHRLHKIAGRVVLVFVALGITLVLIDVAVRLRPKLRIDQLGVEILGNAPFKDQLLKDSHQLINLPSAYYEYWLYAHPPFTSRTVNIGAYYSARCVPDSEPVGQGRKTVWLFGGSAILNLQTIDELTIANFVARTLRDDKIPSTVVNFGVGSFNSSLELIKFTDLLRRVPPAERPTVAVFYDGYNDAAQALFYGPGNMQADLSRKLDAVVTKHFGDYLLMRLSDTLSDRSQLWREYVSPRLWTPQAASRNMDETNTLHESVGLYIDNCRMIRAICQEFKIQPLFVLQPVLAVKKNPTPFEEKARLAGGLAVDGFTAAFYEETRRRMAECPDFLDLSNLFDNRSADDFFDPCHTGPYSGEIIGQAIGKHLATQDRKK